MEVLKCGTDEGSWAERVNKWKKKYYTDRNILHTRKRKAAWIGNIYRMNFPLKHVTEGKIEGAGSRERERKKIPNGIKE